VNASLQNGTFIYNEKKENFEINQFRTKKCIFI